MSHQDILNTLNQLLPDQFREPLKVTAEFGEGRLEPAADAELTIARRYLQRIVTHEELDLGFEMDQGQAIRGLRGLWRRLRKERHEMRPPHERPRLAQPVQELEDRLDHQGLDPIELPEGGVRAYMAQLEDAVRTWWQTVGPAGCLYNLGGWWTPQAQPKANGGRRTAS
jgi:hypothetical protein